MKKTFLSLLLIIVVFQATGCAPSFQATQEAEKVKKGKEIFQRHCSSCHGENAKGKTGPPLATAETARSIEEMEEGSEVETTILRGKGGMPAFEGKLSHQEVHYLLAFLKSLPENN